MSPEDKQCIEKEANEYAASIGNADGTALFDYKRGATAEHERMDELLKEERNKAIDECILDLKAIISPVAFITVKDRLESLKGKSQ